MLSTPTKDVDPIEKIFDPAQNPIERLRIFMEKNELSQRGLAAKCGVQPSHFNEIMNMKRRPSLTEAMNIQELTLVNALSLIVIKELTEKKVQMNRILDERRDS